MDSEEQSALAKEARQRYSEGVDYDRANREDARDDLDMLAGKHWSDEDIAEREDDNRIYLTENRLPAFVSQVMGDIRQQAPAIRVRGVDDGADKGLAEVLTGLIRNIEAGSSTRQPTIKAATHAVQCGIGHFRVLTDYVDAESFDQDIFMEPIADPLAVVWDPDAQIVTREDGMWCFVVREMMRDKFEARYPNAVGDGFDDDRPESESTLNDWASKDTVRVAEYWRKEPMTRRLGLRMDGSVHELGEDDDASGYLEVRERESYRVTMTLIGGNEVLEPPREWPTPHIPIVPVIGEEIQLENRVQRRGVIRFAKDAQRRYNYWITAQTEWLALQPKAPFVASQKQIDGYEAEWANANRSNDGVLPYNSDPNAPGAPQRAQPPVGSTGLYNEVMLAADAMKATTGIYDASLGNQSNETSGRAIRERKQQSATGTYAFIDNLARSVEYAGRIVLALIPKIYDTRRVVRVLGADGAEDFAILNDTVTENGETVTRNDLSVGRYDVTVTTGPSYSTRRAEAAESMIQFIQTLPDAAAVTADLLAKNMDWPGAEEFAARLKKTLPPGVVEIDEDDEDAVAAAEAAAQAQVQQQQMAQADFELEMAKKQAETMKLRADAMRTEREMEQIDAEVANTMADTVLKELEARIKSGAFTEVMQMALDAPPGARFIPAQ